MLKQYSLSGTTLVTPDSVLRDRSIAIDTDRIAGFDIDSPVDFSLRNELYLYPGLINAHDHLRGDYLPRVGPPAGTFYLNWSNWDQDLKSSEVFRERSGLNAEECYLIGAYKNLFSGVTTVQDHFPHEFNEPFVDLLPIRLMNDYTLAHECSSYDLKWGDGIEVEHERAVRRNHPFITHLEEGFDRESREGIEILERLGCLDDHDVLVHCVGFSGSDILKTHRVGAHVCWCPASNVFMYNATCRIRSILEAGINVCLGTDSTHTGSVNLLEEMRFARETYRTLYAADLDPRSIVKMVTVNPARAFRMEGRIGELAAGAAADLLLIRPRHDDPYEALVNADLEDIELLILGGSPIYGAERFEELFALRGAQYTRMSLRGRPRLVKGDPATLLNHIRKVVGFRKVLDFMPIDN